MDDGTELVGLVKSEREAGGDGFHNAPGLSRRTVIQMERRERTSDGEMAEHMLGCQRSQAVSPSLAVVTGSTIASIISLVESHVDRNRISEVCRAFRQYDRRTRRSITLRGLQQNLFCLPLCFTAVTELDITALIRMPEEFPLLNLPESSYLRLQKAFPHLRTLYTPAVNDDCIRILGRIWPRLTKLALSQHPISGLPPCLRTVLQAFKSMEDLDAQYLKCDQISGDFASRSKYGLRNLNLSRIIIRRDNELEVLADKCLELESLSVTVHPGEVQGRGLLALAKQCSKLRSLRINFYMTTSLSPSNGHASCIQALAEICGELPDLKVELSFDRVPKELTGDQMQCLTAMAASIRLLVIYTANAEMKGLFSCHQLTDLTIGICETMTDFELIATVRACPDLHTLRLIDCVHITERGLSGAAQAGSAITSLSLCFLKPALGVLLESVRPLSGSVTALRLMVNRGANSLRGLCGWGQLSRLELTLSCPVPAGVFEEPWLVSCPKLDQLELVIQDWVPVSLAFLRQAPSLTSLSLTMSDEVPMRLVVSYLEEIVAGLPNLLCLSLMICNQEWLSEEAGTILAKCSELKALDIAWHPRASPLADLPRPGLRPFLSKLLCMSSLMNVQLPATLSEQKDLKIFYRGLHAQTMQSLFKAFHDLKEPALPLDRSVSHPRLAHSLYHARSVSHTNLCCR